MTAMGDYISFLFIPVSVYLLLFTVLKMWSPVNISYLPLCTEKVFVRGRNWFSFKKHWVALKKKQSLGQKYNLTHFCFCFVQELVMKINANTSKLLCYVGVGPQYFLFTNIVPISSDIYLNRRIYSRCQPWQLRPVPALITPLRGKYP